jgi:hypothetical protein
MLDWIFRHPLTVYLGFMALVVVNFFGGHALALWLALWLDPTGLAMVPIYGAAMLITAAVALYLLTFKKYPPKRLIFTKAR